jgi:hypothetical protein
MKKLVIAALISAQLTAAQPAFAAALDSGTQTRMGVFAGAQVRIPLGASGPQARAPSAALGISPITNSQRPTGETQMRIGDGLQLRLTPDRPVELAFAGTRLDRFRLGPDGQAPGGQKSGVSTLGWIAIGVAATAVILVGAVALCMEDNECNPSE